MKQYIIATIKPWNIERFHQQYGSDKNWFLISDPKDLTLDKIAQINPRYIFFPHWSHIVPENIINNFECVCFHSSDVPYGRGGSPIQNLIIRGFKDTQLTALRMEKELDAGPVYMKTPLSLEGTAQSIFDNLAAQCFDMIDNIAKTEPAPVPQSGEVVVFKRRTGQDNILPNDNHLEHLYNHIRMLDAKTYPPSYITHGKYVIEFSNAQLQGEEILATVKIKEQHE